jgi:hypothetical protein
MRNTTQRQSPNPELNPHNKGPLIKWFINYTLEVVEYAERIAAGADPGISPALHGEQHAAQNRPIQLESPAQLHSEELGKLVADLARERAQEKLEAALADPAYQRERSEQISISPTDAAVEAYDHSAATPAPAKFFRPITPNTDNMNRYLN